MVSHAPCRAPCARARLEQVRDAREQLRVDCQAAVQAIAGARDQAHGELVLEHDDGRAEGRAVRQQLEGERGGDLVGDVGDAHIEVGQLLLHDVALHHLRRLGGRARMR